MRVRELAAALEVTSARLSRIERGLARDLDDALIGRVAGFFDETGSDEWLLLAGRVPSDLQAILQHHPAESVLLLREHFGRDSHDRAAATRVTFVAPELVAAIVDWAVRSPSDVILDPVCGEGVLLAAAGARLISLGTAATAALQQLYGYDADAEACARTMRRLRAVTGAASRLIRRQDFLSAASRSRLPFEPSGAPAVTAVVGALLSDERATTAAQRREARAAAAEAGVELPEGAATWAAVLVHAASCVRADGRFAVLVPASVLHARYAAAVRAYLAQLFPSLIVVTFEKAVPGLGEVVLLLGEPGERAGVRTLRVSAPSRLSTALRGPAELRVAEGTPLRWSGPSLPTPGRMLLRSLQQAGVLRRLGDLVRIDAGIVTGANSFFLVNAATAGRVAGQFLRPALATAGTAPGLIFRQDDWEQARDGGERSFLLCVPSATAPDGNTQAYLKRGLREGVAERATCRRRPVWYAVPSPHQPAAFLTYLCRGRPRMLLNEAGVTHVNSLHSVEPRSGVNVAAVAASFMTTAALLGCELHGRHYGGSVLKLEPVEAENLLVPYPSVDRIDATAGLLAQLDLLWRRGSADEAVALADQHLLGREANVEGHVVDELRRCYAAERDRRRAG
jgi:adenine-specific DNA-methyltransferase